MKIPHYQAAAVIPRNRYEEPAVRGECERYRSVVVVREPLLDQCSIGDVPEGNGVIRRPARYPFTIRRNDKSVSRVSMSSVKGYGNGEYQFTSSSMTWKGVLTLPVLGATVSALRWSSTGKRFSISWIREEFLPRGKTSRTHTSRT